jgi:hypothetical protein
LAERSQAEGRLWLTGLWLTGLWLTGLWLTGLWLTGLGLAGLGLPAGPGALAALGWLAERRLGLAVSGRGEAWRALTPVLTSLRWPDRLPGVAGVRRELAEGEGSGTPGRKRGAGRIRGPVLGNLVLTGESRFLGARARGGGAG